MKNLKSKLLTIFMAMVMVLGMVPFTVQAKTNNVEIILNGKALVQNSEIGFAVIKDGRTMIPLRLVVENLGFTADWESDGPKVITMQGQNKTVYHLLGSLEATSINPLAPNATVVATTEVPSYVDKTTGRTMVGLRLISEAFGVTVEWSRSATGGQVIMTMAGIDAVDNSKTEASQAQINAWRPTDPKFLNLALDYEKFAKMTVNSKGYLDGVLRNIRGNAANKAMTFNWHIDNIRTTSADRTDSKQFAMEMFSNIDFHKWMTENKVAQAGLAETHFQDISASDGFAYTVVPFVYTGVFDTFFREGGTSNFNGTSKITRNEFVQIINAAGFLRPPNERGVTDGTALFKGNVPDWAFEDWLAFGIYSDTVNMGMTAEQITSNANGYVTRLEAANYIAEELGGSGLPGVNVSGNGVTDRENLVNSKEWQAKATSKFSDFTNFVEFKQGGIGNYDPMYDYQRLTSVMCPNLAWQVMLLADLGIVTDTGTFRPFEPITRAEFAEMFYNALGQRAGRICK